MLFRLACIFVVAVLTHVNAEEPERLVRAVDTMNHEFPATVSIRLNGEHWCGGALISSKHVLTAAHCIVPIVHIPSNVSVVSGTNYLSSGGETSNVSLMFYHSNFLPSQAYSRWQYDIGIIQLPEPLVLNTKQNIIRLPSDQPPIGKYATVSGWGYTNTTADSSSETLKKLSLMMISTEECQTYFRRPIRDIMICALVGLDIGACRGDSGSPLMYKNEVIGIVSGGVPCAHGYPDIFTNVYKYLHEIDDWMKH